METTRRATLVLALLTVSIALPAPAGAGAQGAPERPNLVVVMTDDQTFEELQAMPLTRRLLVDEGVTFSRSYVSYPVCCPSRTTFLTGQYAHNHGVMGLYPPTGGYGRFDKSNALPVWLRKAGYHTAHIGKFLNGYGDQEPADVPPGWSDWHATVDHSTYNMWGYTINHNGRLRTYGRPYDEDPALYQTDVLGKRAESIIERRAGGTRPLFLSLNLLAPHHENRSIQRRTGMLVRPAPRHRDAIPSVRWRRAATSTSATCPTSRASCSDAPSRRPTSRALARRRRPPGSAARSRRGRRAGRGGTAPQRRARRDHDRLHVGQRLHAGPAPGPLGQDAPYDPSTRVPLVIRGAGIPGGQTSGELVANVDLAPTLLELAGATAGKRVDGRSLMPFAQRPGRRTKRAILHETGGQRYASGPREQDERTNLRRPLRRVLPTGPCARRAGSSCATATAVASSTTCARDPDQMHSLHADPRHRRTRRALLRELRRLMRCEGDECRRPIRG